jgi:pantothenate kinase
LSDMTTGSCTADTGDRRSDPRARPEDQGSDSHPSDGGHRQRASDVSHDDLAHEEPDAANNLDALVGRAQALAASGRRHILGIFGPPGGGKSTLAEVIVRRLAPHACQVPMDGFHLANAELDRLGRRSRKGAPDTFDAAGYVALLRRLHEAWEDVVYAPEFRREIEEPVAGAIPVPSDVPLVVTEGNYLLLDDGPWAAVRDLLDEAWYVESDERTRLDLLVQRHITFGKDAGTARAWAHGSDQRNAELVAATRHRADLIIRIHHGVPAAAQPQQAAGRRDRTPGGPLPAQPRHQEEDSDRTTPEAL